MKILIVDDIKGWRNYHYHILNNLFPKADFTFAESAREAYSDRKKELQKDVRGWFPWVYLILGMVL